MSNYYEETIPLEINIDEYLKYYFDESLPLFDKLNTIIKKGQPFQKQALLSKLNLYQSNSFFKSLIQYIINDIETWDKETISIFPKSIYNLLTQSSKILLSSIDNELFNMILKHIIKSITSGDEKISQEYIFYFEKIILFYSFDNIFPYTIDNDIYDNIISLGKFGENELNIKLSCYLCCAIIRILKNIQDENENVKKLYSRVCFLFSNSEKEIDKQLSKDLEFLIPIFQKDILNNSEVLQAIYSYINNDSDHIIQTTVILSLVKNLYYIDNFGLAEKIFDKIKEIFEDEINYEHNYKNNIFYELINSLYTNYKKINIDIIKLLFKENIIPKFIMKNKKDNIIIENFDKLYFIFNDINNELEIWCIEENTENNYNNINFDDLFYSIYNLYFNMNISNQKKITINSNNDNCKNDNIDKEYNLKNTFYNNLMKIIPFLPNLKNSKIMYDKINCLFNKDNILFALNCYSNIIKYKEKNCQSKIDNNIFYIFMTFLLKKNCELFKPIINLGNTKPLSPIKKDQTINITNNNNNQDNYYIRLFNNILNNIFCIYKEAPKSFNNNIHFLLCDFFQRIIRKIYKYLRPTIPNISNTPNNNLYTNNNNNNTKLKHVDKIYEEIFINYLTKLIDDQQIGNYNKNKAIEVFPYLILYSKSRQMYYKYIKENIINSATFFNRRYSIIFLEKCLQIYSFKMFNKIGLLDILLNLVNDNNNAISASIVNLIYIYNRKIILGSNFTFQNICKNLSKINKINKDNKTVSIQNFDIEKNRCIKDILNLNLTNNNPKKNNKNEEYKTEVNNNNNESYSDFDFWEKRENKLMMIENEIFGKDSNYGFYDLKTLVRPQSLTGSSQSPEIGRIKRKNNYLNNLVSNKELISIKGKEKSTKKVLAKDKYSSSTIIISHHNNLHNINYNQKEKTNPKKFLPKIKQNRNNNISNKTITKYNNIKNLNNFKIKQENQKLNEINQKNSIINNNNNINNSNSIVILNDKPTIKSNSGFLHFAQNSKINKAVKARKSLPSFYPDLFSNMNINNNNENNIEDEDKIKNNRISIELNKYKIEINSNVKGREGQINTLYKNKNNILHINQSLRNSKGFKLRRDNSLKDSFGKYNKMFIKFNPETDRFNLTNISFKEMK